MAICISCQRYYRNTPFNTTEYCEDCAYTTDELLFDEEDSLEVEHLINPSGKTPGHFYE